MTTKFDNFHPTLRDLLKKLANPKYALQDILDERYWWIKAGTPVEEEKDVRHSD
ncbi:hypothetical protein HC928_02650 [bacterium]|nr:hypothetical protein [bacterium]